MNLYHDWARAWRIPAPALADLIKRMTTDAPEPPDSPIPARNEAEVQMRVRASATRAGWRLWRNNVGALQPATGGMVRFGLANDTAAMNRMLKSADLVGIKPRRIVLADMGETIGQFVCREVKAPGWVWTGTEREKAQLAWAQLVNGLGGDAGFTTGGL